jgi:hypothetical protein
MVLWLLASLGAMPLGARPLGAQEATPAKAEPTESPDDVLRPVSGAILVSPNVVLTGDDGSCATAPATAPATASDTAPRWLPAWGVVGLRAIPAGPKVAANGELYHPNFSLDLNLNFWLWRTQGLYMFGDLRLWGQRGENGVTNARDGFLGTSKRELDFSGGAAWNYYGSWEARVFGYSQSNLNRGISPFAPAGFHDGSGLENRYYLSSEYARLGQTGFDVARATFLSIGYFPSKDMVGNDSLSFKPGLLLRAYLICDLWDLPCYVFGDLTYISERSMHPRLFLFDLGLAARPFSRHQQWEFRFGADSTADFHTHSALNLWYVSARYIF